MSTATTSLAILAVAATVVAAPPPASAAAPVALWQPARRPPPPPRFDPRGWTKLGERWVQGRRDRDVFRVGRTRTPFTHLTIAVDQGDVEIYDIVITFANGDRYRPRIRHRFGEGSRSRAIDLPGRARFIDRITVRYGNLGGRYRGRARVAIYGRDRGSLDRPPRWESRGWTKLGERTVRGRRDRDRIRVGPGAGAFTKLTVVVSDGDVLLRDMVITLGNGQRIRPELRHHFRDGSRTRVIDLPGRARRIRSIDFRYGNLGPGGRARVAVWARDFAAAPPPPPAWSPRGWVRLGSTWVRGRHDHDLVRVGRRQGRFRALTVQVEGGDLEMYDMVVTFGNGQRWAPRIRHRFRQGSRTRIIDLPGRARRIRSIEFHYGNLPRGRRANVTVWAR